MPLPIVSPPPEEAKAPLRTAMSLKDLKPKLDLRPAMEADEAD
jgi:hypothetical protein